MKKQNPCLHLHLHLHLHLPPLCFQSSEAVAGATPSRSPGPCHAHSGTQFLLLLPHFWVKTTATALCFSPRPGFLSVSTSLLSVFNPAKPSLVPATLSPVSEGLQLIKRLGSIFQ